MLLYDRSLYCERSSSMPLRPPLPDDYLRLSAWISDAAQCLRWAGPIVPYPFAADDLSRLLVVPLPGGASSWSLVGERNELLAFGQLWEREPGCAHIGRVIVDPGVRGKGVGRSLCSQLMAMAAVDGFGRISLRVYRDNASAVRLYMSLGFIEVASEANDEVMLMQAAIGG